MDNRSYYDELYFCARVNRESLPADIFADLFATTQVTPNRPILVFTENGSARLESGGEMFELTPLQFMIMKPRQQAKLLWLDEDASLCVIAFMPALQDGVVQQFSTAFFPYISSRAVWTMDEATAKALHAFYDLYEYNFQSRGGQYSTEIASSLFTMFLQTFYMKVQHQIRTEQRADSTFSTRAIGSKFFRLLGEQYKKNHSVTNYAEQLCISSKYLTQIVKQIANLTPKEIIDRRVGMEAVFLLTKSDMNIQEISIELGFPDQSYFGRFFKRLFGMSPLHYRLNPDMSILERIKMPSR